MVTLEAKPEKVEELRQDLLHIQNLSRKENSCLEYRVHQDINNSCQFFLYENWATKEEHQQQFQKPYIISFGEKLDGLLAKPYQAIFSKEIL